LELSELYDYARRTNKLDLHGYSVASAREIALEFVKAAWEAGHDQVVLIHGAEVVPRFVDLEVAVPHLSPAVW
jgi:hypothetical protein